MNQVLRALKKQEMPPLHVTNGDKEYWLIENRIQDRPLKTLPETEIHQLAVKNIRQKDFRYKMTAVLDGRIKIVTRLIHRRNGKWQVHSRNIHAKGWWLKRGDYYFSSL